MTPPKPWYRKAWKALRKRWVQVLITVVAGVLVAGVCVRLLRPAQRAPDDKTGYNFMHCDQCKTELAYNPEMDGKPCPRCRPPKTGFFQPTRTSIKTGSGDGSPWKWVYISSGFVGVATLGVIVYLLYLPVPDPHATYYVCHCPHCHQRMRFRQVSLGGIGQCPRCKRLTRFPDEDEAVLEADLQRQQDEEYAAAGDDD